MYKIQKYKEVYSGEQAFHSFSPHKYPFTTLGSSHCSHWLIFSTNFYWVLLKYQALNKSGNRGVNKINKGLLPFMEASNLPRWLKVIKIPIYLSRNILCVYNTRLLNINATYHITVLHLAFFSLYIGGYSISIYEKAASFSLVAA